MESMRTQEKYSNSIIKIAIQNEGTLEIAVFKSKNPSKEMFVKGQSQSLDKQKMIRQQAN